MGKSNDTIAAIATPPGEGAVGIIRVSGPRANEIVGAIFRGGVALGEVPGNTVHFGRLERANAEVIDEVLATVFRAPKSYTGEDVVEIGCHGGIMVVREVLAAVLASGARQAEPGEFTRRAFLNGKMDLTRAEAVADLIAAKSERAKAVSTAQLEGKLAGKVSGLRTRLLDVCALLELDLDFSEENLPIVERATVARKVEEIGAELRAMRASYERGKIVRDGLTVAIVGKPNAGKSSLFNALLREHRAIVTPVAGTTRDTLEECITLEGILFTLTDTAGLRETTDIVEAEGVTRSHRAMAASDIILYVIDGSRSDELKGELDILTAMPGHAHKIAVLNKSDITRQEIPALVNADVIAVIASAKTGDGLHRLETELLASAGLTPSGNEEGVWLMNKRHADAIDKGLAALENGLSSLSTGVTNDFIAFDLRECANALAAITGEVTSDEVLNSIFGRFCIGK